MTHGCIRKFAPDVEVGDTIEFFAPYVEEVGKVTSKKIVSKVTSIEIDSLRRQRTFHTESGVMRTVPDFHMVRIR